MIQSSYRDYLALIIWLISIIFICWVPSQSDFHLILYGWIPCSLSYTHLCWKGKSSSLVYVIAAAVIARILACFHFPQLSDDVYRFIWDGKLWHIDIHPYKHIPSDLIQSIEELNPLFTQLNSPDYYSIYPPIPQGIFALCTIFDSNELSALSMQFIHCAFDIGTVYLLWLLLRRMKLPKTRLYLYALHPLIIIETIANLHHEGVVIFFLLGTLFFLFEKKTLVAGIFLGAAIASKILPILFLPLIFFYLRDNARWKFIGGVAASCLLLFGPILFNSGLVGNLLESADLYMRKFEFNASIYYFYRELGYLIYGFNLIHIVGPVLSISTLIIILLISWIPMEKKVNYSQMITLMMWTFLIYLFFSATVHPWYVATVIALCIFSRYRAPLFWGLIILWTYANYSGPEYQEIMWIVLMEYLLVFSFLIYEIKKYKGYQLLRW